MLNKIITIALKNRFFVIMLLATGLGFGLRAMYLTPVDAFPDTTPVQVQVNTVASALSPIEIEQQITLPVELSIAGLPGLVNVRSVSKFGLSQIVATFDDDTHIYDARQFIQERISSVNLPDGIDRPQMGPMATGLGEIFHYIVRSTDPDRSLDELRSLHDWVIKPELRKVAGVAEVNSWGGYERQYQVIVSPELLIQYGLDFDDIFNALQQNNANIGGGQVVTSGQALLVHGIGRVISLDQIEEIVIRAIKGSPVRIRDVAQVMIGHEIRRGAVTAQGRGEVVLGLGFMLMGENSREVTEALKQQLQQVRKSLPEDVILDVVYDRTELVDAVIDTVRHNLFAGALLVIVVLFLLLGNFRAGLIVSLSIPLALIYTFLGMNAMAITASLLSLGAMDFGIIVDGSVVMTENNIRRLAEKQRLLGRTLKQGERLHTIISSSQEVVRPIVFGMGIVLLVFFPILTLEGIEGKMFSPMAWTFIFAMLGGLVIAITLTPILSYYMLPKRAQEEEGWVARTLDTGYTYLITRVLAHQRVLFVGIVLLLGVTVFTASRLGGEFIPKLSEGALVINTIRLAGVSIEESTAYNSRIEALLLKEFPDEVKNVWSRIGSAEVATDPMGTELTDIFISLYPREQWLNATTQAQLVQEMEEVLDDLPGINQIFTQPIEMRINEMDSGIRSDVGIKIFGDDFDELVRLSDELQKILLGVQGAADVTGEQISGQPILQVVVDQEQLSRQGIAARRVLDLVETVGGKPVGEIYEGQRRYPLVVRLPENQRTDVQSLADTLVPVKDGPLLPLRRLAMVSETTGPATINREWGRRLIRVQANVRDRDVVSFVKQAQALVDQELVLPEGYVLEWSGQFEHLERSKLRFMVVIPLTLLLIFLMLYFSLKSLTDVLIIYTSIPFAAIGGIYAIWFRGIPFSVSAAIGFIALSGIAVLNGQVMITTIRTILGEGVPLATAVVSAARQRLRPVLATSITDAVGFVPMAISTGIGGEVQRPLATVVIGGVFTSTLLTLFVLPALYLVVAHFRERKAE